MQNPILINNYPSPTHNDIIILSVVYRRRLQRPRSFVLVVHRVHDQDVQTRRRPRPLQRRHPVLPSAGASRRTEHGVLGLVKTVREKSIRPHWKAVKLILTRNNTSYPHSKTFFYFCFVIISMLHIGFLLRPPVMTRDQIYKIPSVPPERHFGGLSIIKF